MDSPGRRSHAITTDPDRSIYPLQRQISKTAQIRSDPSAESSRGGKGGPFAFALAVRNALDRKRKPPQALTTAVSSMFLDADAAASAHKAAP